MYKYRQKEPYIYTIILVEDRNVRLLQENLINFSIWSCNLSFKFTFHEVPILDILQSHDTL